MSVDMERVLSIIEELKNARADLEESQIELEKLETERDLIDDKIEGREDDVRSDTKRIEELEQDLIALTRDEEF